MTTQLQLINIIIIIIIIIRYPNTERRCIVIGCKPKGNHHPSTYIERNGLFWVKNSDFDWSWGNVDYRPIALAYGKLEINK